MTALPKWSRRGAKPKVESWAAMPMRPGPETDVGAWKEEFSAVMDELSARKASEQEIEAAVRDVCARHDIRCGSAVDTAKLPQPYRFMVQHGASVHGLNLLREGAGEQRWILSDGRWAVVVPEASVARLVAAGLEVPGQGIGAFARLRGLLEPFAAKPSPRQILREFGIGGNASTFTNPHTVDVHGVEFAVDVLAVLALAGGTHFVLDAGARMVEARDADGATVGYGQGMGAPARGWVS